MKNRKKILIFSLILTSIIGIVITGVALYFESKHIDLKSLFTLIQTLGVIIIVPSIVGLFVIFANYLCDVLDED